MPRAKREEPVLDSDSQAGVDAIVDFTKTFDTPSGERVLKHLEKFTDAKCQENPEGAVDPYRCVERQGMRRTYWFCVQLVAKGRELMKRRAAAITTTPEGEHGSDSN